MTRLNDHQVIQALDSAGRVDAVVLVDESSGEEIVVPLESLERLEAAVHYFRRGARLVEYRDESERLTPEAPSPKMES